MKIESYHAATKIINKLDKLEETRIRLIKERLEQPNSGDHKIGDYNVILHTALRFKVDTIKLDYSQLENYNDFEHKLIVLFQDTIDKEIDTLKNRLKQLK